MPFMRTVVLTVVTPGPDPPEIVGVLAKQPGTVWLPYEGDIIIVDRESHEPIEVEWEELGAADRGST